MITTPIAQTTKGRRIWIQGLSRYGIAEGTPYSVAYGIDTIAITLRPLGTCKVRKVSKGKGGIIDLCGKQVTNWANGHATALVYPLYNADTILIEKA